MVIYLNVAALMQGDLYCSQDQERKHFSEKHLKLKRRKCQEEFVYSKFHEFRIYKHICRIILK